MIFTGLFKKHEEPKTRYVVFNEGGTLHCFGYNNKEVSSMTIKISDEIKKVKAAFKYTDGAFDRTVILSDIIQDDIESESELETISKLYNLEKKIKELEEKQKTMDSGLEACECKLINPGANKDFRINLEPNTMFATTNDSEDYNKIYVITGEYPNYSIDKKEIVTNDDFNYCLRELDTNNISMWPKDKCFETYEKANNKVLELIQKETSKEHKCTCKCTLPKKK